jgi:hypothetical protein
MPIIEEPDMKLDNQHEPVRLNGWAALTVGLALLAIIGLTMGAPLTAVVGQVAVVALTSIGGLEFARRHVSPYVPEPDGYDPTDPR